MVKWIAIVEDDSDISSLEKRTIEKEGYQTSVFGTGDAFLNWLQKDKPDISLVVLDIMLPGTSGTDVIRIIRNGADYEMYRGIPIILVSAKDSELDKVLGLELGADDYLSKPFSPRELLARIKALIRRTASELIPAEVGGVIRVSGITIDEKRAMVQLDGVTVELTTAEFKILLILARRRGWVFDRNKIIDQIWEGEKYVTDRTIDVHIKHLREKLGKYGEMIVTIRGMGYKMNDQDLAL